MPEPYLVFHVTAITHRKDAVYPATIVGIPPMEDFYLGGASVKLFLPIFKMNFPEIVDIALPAEGVFHNLVFVSIRKTYPMQAYKIMHGLWGMGQMMFTKYIVMVDADVDVHNTGQVLFGPCANTCTLHSSLLDAKELCGRLERHPVNSLFRQLHGIKADAADLVALLLHGHVKPILLLHGVALALVVAGRVSLLGFLLCGVMERFAHNDSARCASGGDERIAVRDFVTEICTARAERHVADGTCGGAASEQASDESEEKQFGCVCDEFHFHNG
ncbi:MAG: UbiD family decarboxylase [Verrucomicrobia subdivision 3 bacterium]|nr:UbiD family decarboxylase [Limisphaerales bacterium]